MHRGEGLLTEEKAGAQFERRDRMTTVRGSCLCGGVRFEIDGTLMQSFALPPLGGTKRRTRAVLHAGNPVSAPHCRRDDDGLMRAEVMPTTPCLALDRAWAGW
jgi:hypothetical protein